MLSHRSKLFCTLLTLGALPACTHTPPGTSVEIALAKKPEIVRVPATPTPAPTRQTASAGSNSEPSTEKTERVADAYSRGEFCMKTGKDAEAIAAFQEVVKLDPSFADAWNNLAALYEKTGKEKEAMNAFKHGKLARQ